MSKFNVVGGEVVGDKARELIVKENSILEAGFNLPRTDCLSQEFFNSFFRSLGLGSGSDWAEVSFSPDLVSRVKRADVSSLDLGFIEGVVKKNEGLPLVVRSSALGDSRGTGVYSSEISKPDVVSVAEKIKLVLASYFSRDAFEFRRVADIGPGFGVMVQPLIGNVIEEDLFGDVYRNSFTPFLSGFGYTSTSQGEGYVAVVPGFGGGS